MNFYRTLQAGSALRPLTILLFLFAVSLQPPKVTAAENQEWEVAARVNLKGYKVAISKPVLVGRSSGYFWFPSLIRYEGNRLLAVMSNYADKHVKESTSSVAWSEDGGLNWSQLSSAHYGNAHLHLPNGNLLLLPYYLKPDGKDLVAPYQLVTKDRPELHTAEANVRVTGWPREVGSFAPELGLAGFVFNGQSVKLKQGGYLATLYGFFKNDKRMSLVAAESTDGTNWKIRSIIADSDCPLTGSDGPCESAIARLKDGRLMCVFRLASKEPLGQCYSSDEGKTWSKPTSMDGPFSVEPSLAVMQDGAVALSSGRPGIYCWLNLAGDGEQWQSIDLLTHHNATQSEKIDPVKTNTSSYTEVIPDGEDGLLVIYDRLPNGWNALPDGTTETNSVWIVRLRVER